MYDHIQAYLEPLTPYVERAFAKKRRFAIVSAAVSVFLCSILAALFVTFGASTSARSWRGDLSLEDEYYGAVRWEQCGFCVTETSQSQLRYWHEHLSRVTPEEVKHCVLSERKDWDEACDLKSSRIDGATHEARMVYQRIADFEASDYGQEELPKLYARRAMIEAVNYIPKVEAYRSLLGPGDFMRVWGLVCGWSTPILVIFGVPLTVIMRVGRERYDQTWTLLLATQQGPARICAGLIAQALVPIAAVGIPLLAVTTLAMTVMGHPFLALSMWPLAALFTLIWCSGAMLVVTLAARNFQPPILMLAGLGMSAVYFGMTSSSYPRLSGTGSGTWLMTGTGVEWVHRMYAALAVASDPVSEALAPSWLMTLAWLPLAVAAFLFVRGHARRLVPSVAAPLSASMWVLGWCMGGLALGLRALMHVMERDHYVVSMGRDSVILVMLVSLAIPLSGYLRHRAHPEAAHGAFEVGIGSYGRRVLESWAASLGFFGAIGLSLCASPASVAWSHSTSVPELLLTALTFGAWSLMACAFTQLGAQGLSTWRQKALGVWVGAVLLTSLPTIIDSAQSTNFYASGFELGPGVSWPWVHAFVFTVTLLGCLVSFSRSSGAKSE